MLNTADVIAFVATAQPEQSKAFYADTLGLTIIEESPVAIVFDSNGTQLRVAIVQSHTPPPFTVLGWEIADIAAEVDALSAKGITFEVFEGMDQDARGVWLSPGGAKVAWFKDPDGNVLSLTESGA